MEGRLQKPFERDKMTGNEERGSLLVRLNLPMGYIQKSQINAGVKKKAGLNVIKEIL